MSLLRAKEKRPIEGDEAKERDDADQGTTKSKAAHRAFSLTVIGGKTTDGEGLVLAVREVGPGGEAVKGNRWLADEVVDAVAEWLVEALGAPEGKDWK